MRLMAAILLGSAMAGTASVFLSADFEDGQGLESRSDLALGSEIAAEVLPRGDGAGSCLRLANRVPGAFCGIDLLGPFSVCPNLVLEFDYKAEIEAGFEGAYLGISFYGTDGRQSFWDSQPFVSEWRHAMVVIPLLQSRFRVDIRPGLEFGRIQLYGRVKDQTSERAATRCRMTVWFDNIRIHAPEAISPSGVGSTYVSHNNPPFLDWHGTARRAGRLQLSSDPGFPPEATLTIAVPEHRSYLIPAEPLAPGEWYFRVETESELLRGWSPAQGVHLPERTHAYRLQPLPFERLRQAPRPRLLARLRPGGETVSAAERESLLRQARQAAQQGVPEHPGPYREGDPRWPRWIDWYGQVADRTTARTGSSLKRVATAAILTRDPEAVAASRDLLLAACGWDPDGGSGVRHGDLQAASLLQGMVWCFDACEETLAGAERELVLGVLRQRIVQFTRNLSPFRLNPSQNHPWRQALAAAEAALVTLGTFAEADEWLDVAAHVLAYRILPSMGFAGENQEGIMYWHYGVNMLADFAELLLTMAGVNVYDHPWLAATCMFPVVCAPPGGYAVSFADNSAQGNASVKGPYGVDLVGLLGARSGNPYALWYAARQAPGMVPRPPADMAQSAFYPHIGQAFFNTCLSDGRENVAVALRCGPYHAGHQHDDNNGFVIHAYGDKLAVDGGYYDWYGSPHFEAYSIRTLAHNTLLVDGEGQKRATDGRIAACFDSPGFGWVVGDASNPAIYAGRLRRFDRRLLFVKPNWVVIHDLVETDGVPRRLDWLLHAHTQEAFPGDAAAATFSIARPDARLDGRFLHPAGLRMRVDRSFDIAPQKPRASVFLPWDEVQPEWTLTAGLPEPVAAADLLAVMAVGRAGEDVPSAIPLRRIETDNALGCHLPTPFGSALILLRKRTGVGMLEAEGLSCDGDAVAVLRTPGGELLNAFAARATQVTLGPRRLLDRQVPGDWALDAGVQPQPLRAALRLDGKPLELEGRRHALPDGDVCVWWTTLPEDAVPGRATLKVVGWSGRRPPLLRLGNEPFAGPEVEVALRPGSCLTICGSGGFDAVQLDSIRE